MDIIKETKDIHKFSSARFAHMLTLWYNPDALFLDKEPLYTPEEQRDIKVATHMLSMMTRSFSKRKRECIKKHLLLAPFSCDWEDASWIQARVDKLIKQFGL